MFGRRGFLRRVIGGSVSRFLPGGGVLKVLGGVITDGVGASEECGVGGLQGDNWLTLSSLVMGDGLRFEGGVFKFKKYHAVNFASAGLLRCLGFNYEQSNVIGDMRREVFRLQIAKHYQTISVGENLELDRLTRSIENAVERIRIEPEFLGWSLGELSVGHVNLILCRIGEGGADDESLLVIFRSYVESMGGAGEFMKWLGFEQEADLGFVNLDGVLRLPGVDDVIPDFGGDFRERYGRLYEEWIAKKLRAAGIVCDVDQVDPDWYYFEDDPAFMTKERFFE